MPPPSAQNRGVTRQKIEKMEEGYYTQSKWLQIVSYVTHIRLYGSLEHFLVIFGVFEIFGVFVCPYTTSKNLKIVSLMLILFDEF